MKSRLSYWKAGLLAALLGWVLAPAAWAANQLQGIRIWPSPDNTRVVLDLEHAPDYSYFTLTEPDRLVIDLKQTRNQVKFSTVTNSSKLVTKVRDSRPPASGTYRLVLELRQAVKPILFPLKPTGPYGERLVIDLPYEDSSQPQVVSKADPSSEDIIVAIDAGHGGEDPGAIGGRRTYEKDVTLQIAKRLAAKINAEPGMKAVMVRSGDYFVNLNKRSEIARKHQAHILVSVHADGFTSPRPQGASVWVLSHRRANTEIGRWLERHEEQSELLGGTGEIIRNNAQEKYLTRTLLDMSMDHAMNAGYEVSSDILQELGKITKLHKSKPEHASLAVLKSPDIPSVLVEAGFITNPSEEKLLASSRHQQRIADAIFGGLRGYFMNKPPEGTLFASLKSRKHVVRRGESLSVIASRYGISLSRLKQVNQLSTDLLKIGQVLVIPTS